jgi:hypothetical protein
MLVRKVRRETFPGLEHVSREGPVVRQSPEGPTLSIPLLHEYFRSERRFSRNDVDFDLSRSSW